MNGMLWGEMAEDTSEVHQAIRRLVELNLLEVFGAASPCMAVLAMAQMRELLVTPMTLAVVAGVGMEEVHLPDQMNNPAGVALDMSATQHLRAKVCICTMVLLEIALVLRRQQ